MKSRQAKKIVKILCGTTLFKISDGWFVRDMKYKYDRKDNLIRSAFNYYGKGIKKGKVKLYKFITRV